MNPRTFAERLRNFRREKRLYQKEAAAVLGISRVYYSRLENGRAKPSFELYSRISGFLYSGSSSASSITNVSRAELCRHCRSLTEKERKTIAGIILWISNR